MQGMLIFSYKISDALEHKNNYVCAHTHICSISEKFKVYKEKTKKPGIVHPKHLRVSLLSSILMSEEITIFIPL